MRDLLWRSEEGVYPSARRFAPCSGAAVCAGAVNDDRRSRVAQDPAINSAPCSRSQRPTTAPRSSATGAAGQVGVARVVVDPEEGMIDCRNELAEDVHLLGELGILPEIILVVVLQNEGDAAFLGEGKAFLDRFGGQPNAFLD